jgi:Tol biopolymer transport system component
MNESWRNPYIAGSPIRGEEMFFGRDNVFAWLRAHLIGKFQDNAIVIYGERRTGKTSVLCQIPRRLGDPAYVPFFIDLQQLSFDTISLFLWQVATKIWGELRRVEGAGQVNRPDKKDFEAAPGLYFGEIFLSQVQKAVGQRKLLVMFDEFSRMLTKVKTGGLPSDVFDYLRSLMADHRLTLIISLGSRLEEMVTEYSVLFNQAIYHKITFLDEPDARALITQPVAQHYTYQDEAVDFILRATSGHPFYIQHMCHAIFARRGAGDSQTVCREEVAQALSDVVEATAPNLKFIWDDVGPAEKVVLAAMAALVNRAGDVASQADIISLLSANDTCPPVGELAAALQSLRTRDIIREGPIRKYGRLQLFGPSKGLRSPIGLVRRGSEAGKLERFQQTPALQIGKSPIDLRVSKKPKYGFAVEPLRVWLSKERRLDYVRHELKDEIKKWPQPPPPPPPSWRRPMAALLAAALLLVIGLSGALIRQSQQRLRLEATATAVAEFVSEANATANAAAWMLAQADATATAASGAPAATITAIVAAQSEAKATATAAAESLAEAKAIAMAATEPPPSAVPTPTDTASPARVQVDVVTPVPTKVDRRPLTGDRLIQITQDSADEYVPSFSPDQRTLIIQSNRTGSWHIFTLDLESGDWRQLTGDGTEYFAPRISPNGENVVFASGVGDDRGIYTMRLDGTDMRRLTDTPGTDTYPSYSLDGQHIAFMSKRSGSWGVYMMNADGSGQRMVIDTAADETYPSIAPDGQSIAFQSNASGNWEICVTSIEEGQPLQLTDNPSRDANPAFSPDGRRIAFETRRDGNYEIYLMDSDGSNLRNLTNFPEGNDQVPSFSPDGQWVVFQSDRNGSWDIFRTPVPR